MDATVGPLAPSCSRKVPSCTADGVKRAVVGLSAHHFTQHAQALVKAASREAVNLDGSLRSKCFCMPNSSGATCSHCSPTAPMR